MAKNKPNNLEKFTLVEYVENDDALLHYGIDGFYEAEGIADAINEDADMGLRVGAMFEIYRESDKQIVYSEAGRKGKFKDKASFESLMDENNKLYRHPKYQKNELYI